MGLDVERYESVRYPGRAYEFTHPDRLATVARLRGLAAPDVSTAHVLEVGCGDGMNLLGMACSLPRARFVGVDRCPEPLEVTRRAASELGVTNLELRAIDVADLTRDDAPFDYVIAHGILSWVPDGTKRAMMAALGNVLSPEGVALVSYNALPGWRFRVIARDVILAAFGRPPHRDELAEARRLVHLFAEQLNGAGLYGAVMGELTEYVDDCTDTALYHDLLSPDCDALDFRGFASLAHPAGLQYLGDAVWADNIVSGYPQPFQELLARVADQPTAREQLIDVMRNTLFRRSVLCRAGREVRWVPRPDDLRGLFVAPCSYFDGTGPEGDRYRTCDDVIVTVSSDGLRRGLALLRERAPDATSMEDFLAAGGGASEEHAALILQSWAGGLFELLPRDRPHSAPAGPRPASYPLARWAAASGSESVINCCHEQIAIGPIDRVMLRLCDGQRTTEELVRALVAAADAGEFNILVDEEPTGDPALRHRAIAAGLDERLDQLRTAGLLAV